MTKDQVFAARRREPWLDPETSEQYVLVRVAEFERLRLFVGDEPVFTSAETLDDLMKADDEDDLQLAELQIKYASDLQ